MHTETGRNPLSANVTFRHMWLRALNRQCEPVFIVLGAGEQIDWSSAFQDTYPSVKGEGNTPKLTARNDLSAAQPPAPHIVRGDGISGVELGDQVLELRLPV